MKKTTLRDPIYNEIQNCPVCNSSWVDRLYTKAEIKKQCYPHSRFISRLIAFYSYEKDATVAWICPDCGATWDRYTGRQLKNVKIPGKTVSSKPRKKSKWIVQFICDKTVTIQGAGKVGELNWWVSTEKYYVVMDRKECFHIKKTKKSRARRFKTRWEAEDCAEITLILSDGSRNKNENWTWNIIRVEK